jgi:ATP-dependent exoDNAse (exonuclease V) beta subunit
MTVHKAKGLEFPVVVLADIGCKLHRANAQRHLDSARGLAAINLTGWTPLDLSEQNDLETARDRAEGVRLAYVAATRAKDLLVIPAVGDAPFEKGWAGPLSAAIYPPGLAASQVKAPGVPAFAGRDTVLQRPRDEGPSMRTVQPGAYEFIDPMTNEPFTVVWWDPLLLEQRGDERRGLRREDLITREARQEDVDADRARYERWRAALHATNRQGATASLRVMTATEWARSRLPEPLGDLDEPPAAPTGLPLFDTLRDDAPRRVVSSAVIQEDASTSEPRPAGRRFGVLVHALMAAAPLDATPAQCARLAALYARVLAATEEERDAAAVLADRALRHSLLEQARSAVTAGRRCQREAPITIARDDVLIDGQIDLAFESDDGWVVVDFKTDAEPGESDEAYRRQVALYADSLSQITGRPARGVILRI